MSINLHHTGFVYGLGASTEDLTAQKILVAAKGRDTQKSFIVLLPGRKDLAVYGIEPTAKQKILLDQFWPGNLTVIFPYYGSEFSHLSKENSLALRMPLNKTLLAYLQKHGHMVSTSVNKSGQPPLQELVLIKKEFGHIIDNYLLPAQEIIAPASPSTIVGFSQDGIPQLLREGSVPYLDVQKAYTSPEIIFVCVGNTCRSPLAEYSAKNLQRHLDLPFSFSSGGIAGEDKPMADFSRQLLAKDGIAVNGHTSSLITPLRIARAFKVITMTTALALSLKKDNPLFAHKITTLGELSGSNVEVADPIGKPLENYNHVYNLIKAELTAIFTRWKQEYF